MAELVVGVFFRGCPPDMLWVGACSGATGVSGLMLGRQRLPVYNLAHDAVHPICTAVPLAEPVAILVNRVRPKNAFVCVGTCYFVQKLLVTTVGSPSHEALRS